MSIISFVCILILLHYYNKKRESEGKKPLHVFRYIACLFALVIVISILSALCIIR